MPFATAVVRWQKLHGRHDLPWQGTRDPYRIWLSEIMLQQTQVATVIPYFHRFIQRFPDVHALAAAPVADVLALWSGLGYYARARNLHRCAQQLVDGHDGLFPPTQDALSQLPGVGRSTAAAIAAFAFGTRAAILDGNVKRVFARHFGIEGYPGDKAVEQQMWALASSVLPPTDIEAYTQGLMDLGATVCTRSKPRCNLCPLARDCVALASRRTTELPLRKPQRVTPEKQIALLAIVHRGQVLLAQRPASGIWGGLWSLPEIDWPEGVDAPEQKVIAQAVGAFGHLVSCDALPVFSHSFTHFRLHILPLHIRLGRRHRPPEQGIHAWLRLDGLADVGLPAPIRKLLNYLATVGAHAPPQ